MFYLVPMVVFFPLIGLLINLIFGKAFGEKLIGLVASLAAGAAFVVAVLLAVSLSGQPEGDTIHLLDWINIGNLALPWNFRVDTLSVTMMLVVSGVGTLIHIYSIGYMHDDVRHNGDPARYRKFFIYLNLFIMLMMVLVSADNYVMLFVGWEGVGLCSYLLIGFWFEKGEKGIGNAIAAKKAMVANRVGDFGFLIAAFMMFRAFSTLEFNQVFQSAQGIAGTAPQVIIWITLFLLLGVTGKSAQIPLFVWLPDAMAGPTPVSALIHAATMVTAGVYLVARSFPLYVLVPQAQNIVALVGGITALYGALRALGQFDIKKVLAYSTISQLGFMVAAVGMGAFAAGIFHLVMHAFFKALLFLSAGAVIQGVERGEHAIEHDPRLARAHKSHNGHGQHEFNAQDMRNMGGLRTRLPITFWVYLIGALALAGLAPFAGFWSKDEILNEASHLQPAVFWLLVIAAFFTALYIGRQVLMVFFGEPRSVQAEHAEENPPLMTVPLIILAVLSTIGGIINLPVRGLEFLSEWLKETITVITPGEPGPNMLIVIGTTLITLIAFGLAYLVYYRLYNQQKALPAAKRPDDPLRTIIGPVFSLLEVRWFDEFYRIVIIDNYGRLAKLLNFGEAESGSPTLARDWVTDFFLAGGFKVISNFLAMTFDLGFVDALVNVFAESIKIWSARLRRLQSGFVTNYALAVFLGVVVILGYLILAIGRY